MMIDVAVHWERDQKRKAMSHLVWIAEFVVGLFDWQGWAAIHTNFSARGHTSATNGFLIEVR